VQARSATQMCVEGESWTDVLQVADWYNGPPPYTARSTSPPRHSYTHLPRPGGVHSRTGPSCPPRTRPPGPRWRKVPELTRHSWLTTVPRGPRHAEDGPGPESGLFRPTPGRVPETPCHNFPPHKQGGPRS
jgi:hypothetical protein